MSQAGRGGPHVCLLEDMYCFVRAPGKFQTCQQAHGGFRVLDSVGSYEMLQERA